MSDLLSHKDYQATAKGLSFPANAFIDGSFRPAKSGKTFPTVNPADGAQLAAVAADGAEDVDFAVAKARATFEDGRWSRQHPAERKRCLLTLAKLIERNRHELAIMDSLDSGEPIRDCAGIDIPETVNTLR